MNEKHKSVLLEESINYLNLNDKSTIVDCTLGYAGHSSEILKNIPNGFLIGFDQDKEAIEYSCNRLSKISNNYKIIKSNFVNIKNELSNIGIKEVDGILYVSKYCVLTKKEYIYGNIRITRTGQLTVQGNIEMGGNGTLTVESGGKLIVDGGKLSNVNLDLRPGANLMMLNNGIIETRKGFKAPVGAKVKIIRGKVL